MSATTTIRSIGRVHHVRNNANIVQNILAQVPYSTNHVEGNVLINNLINQHNCSVSINIIIICFACNAIFIVFALLCYVDTFVFIISFLVMKHLNGQYLMNRVWDSWIQVVVSSVRKCEVVERLVWN